VSGAFLPNKACAWLSQAQEGENGVSHLFKNKKSNPSSHKAAEGQRN